MSEFDVAIPPNMEGLVSRFLRDQDILAPWIGDRVYTALPKGVKFPAVRVTQLIDQPTSVPLWSVAVTIQVEAWGGQKYQAWRIAATCRALIDAGIVGVHDGFGVVNGSTPGPLLDLPDEDFSPAKPRWLFTSTIYGRPLATMPAS